MPLNVALQIDPLAGLDPAGDTSLLIGREAIKRGHDLYYLRPESVSYANSGVVTGEIAPLGLFEPLGELFYELGDARYEALDQFDVIFVRQDPPFDMGYISNSLMLGRLMESSTLVVNHPASVRNHPEKMLPFRFPEYCPPTLISADIDAIREFHRNHGAVVIKPAYGYGGMGIFKIPQNGENLEALLEAELSDSREPLVVQAFLPEVAAEEKRILMVNGTLIGAYGRIPAGSEIRSNTRVGGTAVATELTDRQQAIASDVGRYCADMGLMLVGVDVIGDWLTEVNTTSPTGLMHLKELYGTTPEADVWNAVEAAVAKANQ